MYSLIKSFNSTRLPVVDLFYLSFEFSNFNFIYNRYIERPLRAEKLLVDLQKMNEQPEEFGKLNLSQQYVYFHFQYDFDFISSA